MGSALSGLIGLAILALDIWAILHIVRSSAEVGIKVLWVLLILFLPVVGLIIWALAGPRGDVRI
ncbi:PLDc_N domain-containing protein [Pseudomonas sp. PDM14]|uniref:PLDc N-terminal domain-containing protein n=1 Tax=Pseudomonas sp. PDM14 TaxID=2769288 RepID=UPI001785817D|nr:PLD nuclease N-terminal domain-containing protein [Pseudomonas sp. PDM14]MBD9484273.1 PLDc_N domain-containing protein [Pseudomonas sp. PDM14]